MTQFKSKIYVDKRLMYVPKKVEEVVGNDVIIVLNAYSATMFKEGMDIDKVIESQELILNDLRMRKKWSDNEKETEVPVSI